MNFGSGETKRLTRRRDDSTSLLYHSLDNVELGHLGGEVGMMNVICPVLVQMMVFGFDYFCALPFFVRCIGLVVFDGVDELLRPIFGFLKLAVEVIPPAAFACFVPKFCFVLRVVRDNPCWRCGLILLFVVRGVKSRCVWITVESLNLEWEVERTVVGM